MPYQDPTDITTSTSSTTQVTSPGQYTGELQHVIIGGVDWLIVDSDENRVTIYKIDPTTGSLINSAPTSPQTVTWTLPASGETEVGTHDDYQFFTNPNTGEVVGFDADWSGVSQLRYDQTTQTWTGSYDPETTTNTIGLHHEISGGFAPFEAADGNLYAYASNGFSQNFYKYQYDWTTNSWTDTGTSYTAASLGSTNTTDDNWGSKVLTAPDGSMYMVNATYDGGINYQTHIWKIDPTNGNLIAQTPHIRIDMGTSQSGLFINGELEMDPHGNIVIAGGTGLKVIDPDTGTILFNDTTGGTMGQIFHRDGDLIFKEEDGITRAYYISRNGDVTSSNTYTQIYDINPSTGAWTFTAGGQDVSSNITWTGNINGTNTDMNVEVTTLSSGLNMIYTAKEQTTGGPITLVTATISTIGEPPPPICFVRGSRILTDRGEVPVEELQIDDLVETLDHGLQPIRWIGSTIREARGDLAPILIRKGALGNARDLRVSPQHRMLVTGWQAELLFGEAEVLVAAKHLVNDHSIRVDEGGQVEYFHILFDTHQVVFAEGAPSESFHPGAEGQKSISPEARKEILALFPHMEGKFASYGAAVRPSLKGYEGRALAACLTPAE